MELSRILDTNSERSTPDAQEDAKDAKMDPILRVTSYNRGDFKMNFNCVAVSKPRSIPRNMFKVFDSPSDSDLGQLRHLHPEILSLMCLKF